MIMSENIKYTHRFLARIVVKAETPIAVSSGEKDVTSDKLIARDINGLPYIQGTAIAGVIRHAIGEERAKVFFGCSAEDDVEKLGKGSEIIFSSAYIIDKNKHVVEGLISNNDKSDYLKLFDELPVRQHVSVDNKGVNKKRGKFDEEVVYKGTHFCFEIEMFSDGKNQAEFDAVLDEIASETFRIGSGTRKGFGQLSIVECKKVILDLANESDRRNYLMKKSSLNDAFWNDKEHVSRSNIKNEDWIKYELLLNPNDFYLFGSGFGDEDADMTPVSEVSIKWDFKEGTPPEFNTKYILIPATSIKGAISHRVAFHYNKLNGYTIKETDGKFIVDENAEVGVKNEAVKALFGYTVENDNLSKRGNVIMSDLIEYELDKNKTKLLNHVAIDRFTGGAMDGALFSEKTIYGKEHQYKIEILVSKKSFTNSVIKEAFEKTLDDIKNGMLPLGGGTNRGNGCFSGSWTIKNT